MVEYLAKAMNADRLRRLEALQCPPSYCRHEFREDRPREKPDRFRSY